MSMTEIRYVRQHLKKRIGPTRTTCETGWNKNFNNDHIRKLHSFELDRHLKFVANTIFYYRYFPLNYRCATIFPLEKANKLNLWDKESYRGISNNHQGAMFVESLIFYRIRYVAGNKISEFQSGGRARCGCSTVDTHCGRYPSVHEPRSSHPQGERI